MKSISKTLGPGIVAGIIVACSGPVARTTARFMEDAGSALIDAGGRLAPDANPRGATEGRDSGRGIGLLGDAARALTDASQGMTKDASAQSCASCSSGGAVRMMTADSDASQIRSGYEDSSTTNGAQFVERVPGPFIVTSLIPGFLGGDAQISLAVADPGGCGGTVTLLAQVSAFVTAVSGYSRADSNSIQNGRYLVPKGKVLCVSGATFGYSWAGFKPYD